MLSSIKKKLIQCNYTVMSDVIKADICKSIGYYQNNRLLYEGLEAGSLVSSFKSNNPKRNMSYFTIFFFLKG